MFEQDDSNLYHLVFSKSMQDCLENKNGGHCPNRQHTGQMRFGRAGKVKTQRRCCEAYLCSRICYFPRLPQCAARCTPTRTGWFRVSPFLRSGLSRCHLNTVLKVGPVFTARDGFLCSNQTDPDRNFLSH